VNFVRAAVREGRGACDDARVKRPVVLMLLLALAAACSAPAPEPGNAPPAPAPATTTPPPPQLRLTERCTNARHGFTVSFPERWHTNDDSVIPACSVFHPEPVQVPRDSELPFELAVVLNVEQTSADQLTRSSQWERVVSSAPATIAGRPGVRVEVEATGEGLAERGMRTTRYVAELGNGRTLVASTHSASADYARNAEVLRRMVETVTF
jgi:hypothetical protein